MATDLIDIEEDIADFANLITQLLLVRTTLLCLEPHFMNSFTELQECLILDPS